MKNSRLKKVKFIKKISIQMVQGGFFSVHTTNIQLLISSNGDREFPLVEIEYAAHRLGYIVHDVHILMSSAVLWEALGCELSMHTLSRLITVLNS